MQLADRGDMGVLAWQGGHSAPRQTPRRSFQKGGSTREAKKICLSCEVRSECLGTRSRTTSFGIWGGLSERERRKLRNRAV